jgi:hypothetical protein
MPGGVGVPTLRCTASDGGEVYMIMICQGAGGGYGDVLERDPEVQNIFRSDAILMELADLLA